MGAALKHLDELVCVGRGQRDIGCAVGRQDLESGGLQVGAGGIAVVDEASGIGQEIFEAIEGNRAGGARLVNLYGPTEATVDVTHHACDAAGSQGVVYRHPGCVEPAHPGAHGWQRTVCPANIRE